mmetsp:Transcript_42963/g.67382  ORF Transcript_42963/g.67382 Transcript_42963/m.67382 type:complete len:121 (+) Transcript_42963:3-365(+)
MICLEGLRVGQHITRLPCVHRFHTDCLLRWAQTKLSQKQNVHCPSCSRQLMTPCVLEEEEEPQGPAPLVGIQMCGRKIELQLRHFLYFTLFWLVLVIGIFVWRLGGTAPRTNAVNRNDRN